MKRFGFVLFVILIAATIVLPVSAADYDYLEGLLALGKGDNKAAQTLLLKEAEKGNVEAYYPLGLLYARGTEGVPRDDKEALKWISLAAKAGQSKAMVFLGQLYLKGFGTAKDPNEAAKWFKLAAEKGNAEGQYNLGVMYDNGWGVSRDEAEAVKWYREATEQGYAAAQNSLGTMYSNGQGVSKDDVEAAKWFRKAAEQGYAMAQNNLGVIYNNGQGVTKDEVEAVKWYRKAAEQGHAAAQNDLGLMYSNGQGVTKDDVEAVKWFRKGAEQGYALSQNNLGFMYATGRGVSKDDVEAAKWYRNAAEQGYATAQASLGFKYYTGQGVTKDDTEAMKWYRNAAEQGNAGAQLKLGLMLVTKDEAEAVKWYRKAAEQGNKEAIYMLNTLQTKEVQQGKHGKMVIYGTALYADGTPVAGKWFYVVEFSKEKGGIIQRVNKELTLAGGVTDEKGFLRIEVDLSEIKERERLYNQNISYTLISYPKNNRDLWFARILTKEQNAGKVFEITNIDKAEQNKTINFDLGTMVYDFPKAFDSLEKIPGLNADFDSLKLLESGYDTPEKSQRVYSTTIHHQNK